MPHLFDISPAARRALLPAAAAAAFSALGAGIASADTGEVPTPLLEVASDSADATAPPPWGLPSPAPAPWAAPEFGPLPGPAPETEIHRAAAIEPVPEPLHEAAFEPVGSEFTPAESASAHGDAAGAAPGPVLDDAPLATINVSTAEPSRPVVLVPAAIGSTEIPAAPAPAVLKSATVPTGLAAVDPIHGAEPSRTLILTPPAAASVHPARFDAALDKAAIIYDAHPVARVSDADIAAGLSAAGVGPTVAGMFTSATRTIIGGESGGSTNAVNRWDSNAWGAMQSDGAPHNSSRGLMQTIPGTFAAHHAPGTSASIYDPVANIAAAWRYINHRYKVDLTTGAGLDSFMARGTGRGVGY
ncbi:transglycosylase SLT domain-containing protein [Mycolicibacterium sp.]|uniref:transglycosylase SLT domain-containing protein n=1 Tax=Mycolicibacterium sp. TaxID=2320850 RepID=UPI0035601DCA